MSAKIPLRKPLILTHVELLYLIRVVGDRYEDLSKFYARGRGWQRKLREALVFLGRIQKKLWNV